MSDPKANVKSPDQIEIDPKETFYKEVLSRSYQPRKADMEMDISVDVTPERLADAALKGGAPRREN